ncbi:Low-density lipoprotein receptor-like 1 [Homarus americanus]|uniref:Low-density lipoprotein receptor-like 1 n=1 Tax=Homarus americanus TaxID=6706 RepID=A0A8J5N8Z6_HOMAM|nr:Low-density lipoprotein receptor-like 1 [Homarus americanus]
MWVATFPARIVLLASTVVAVLPQKPSTRSLDVFQSSGNRIVGRPVLTTGGSLLGESCAVSKNCGVTSGVCEKGRCARVGDMCRSHEQCRLGSRGSFCNFTVPRVYGRCQCSSDVPKTPGRTCGHLRYSLGSPCGTSAQCSNSVPGSVCVIQHDTPLPTPSDIIPNSISAIPGVPPRSLVVPLAVCACPSGHLVVENGTRCIPVLKDAGVTPASLGQRCEGSNQCRASDPFTFCRAGVCHCIHNSAECSADKTGCYKDTFQCVSSGRCISWYYVCNGVRECDDGSDEAYCLPHRCPRLAHTCNDGTCISRAHLCDGIPHCPDGSDESSCNGSAACPASTFRCGGGRCLPGFVFCNATPTCSDGSDEDVTACIQGSITASYCPFRSWGFLLSLQVGHIGASYCVLQVWQRAVSVHGYPVFGY